MLETLQLIAQLITALAVIAGAVRSYLNARCLRRIDTKVTEMKDTIVNGDDNAA